MFDLPTRITRLYLNCRLEKWRDANWEEIFCQIFETLEKSHQGGKFGAQKWQDYLERKPCISYSLFYQWQESASLCHYGKVTSVLRTESQNWSNDQNSSLAKYELTWSCIHTWLQINALLSFFVHSDVRALGQQVICDFVAGKVQEVWSVGRVQIVQNWLFCLSLSSPLPSFRPSPFLKLALTILIKLPSYSYSPAIL